VQKLSKKTSPIIYFFGSNLIAAIIAITIGMVVSLTLSLKIAEETELQ